VQQLLARESMMRALLQLCMQHLRTRNLRLTYLSFRGQFRSLMMRMRMYYLHLKQHMEPCKLRLDRQEMKLLSLIDQVRELVSRRQAQTQVRLLQILRALKLSLIFPLFDIGVVLGEN
jgi:hypothetical protein